MTHGRSGVSGTRHTFRVLLAGWRAEISAAAEYRADAVSGLVISAIWLAVAAVPAIVVAGHSVTAAGWTLPRMLFVLAVWYLMDAVMWVVLLPNVGQWSAAVQTGSLDAVLLRPVDSLLFCSLRLINVQDLPKIALALGLATTAAALEGPGSLPAVLATLVAVVAAACLMWAGAVLASYKVLTQVQFDGMFALHAAHNLARVPVPLYGPTIRLFLTAFIPVAFLATVPAEIFFGVAAPWLALVSVGVAIMAIKVTRILWARELRRYVGAMS